MAKKKIISSVEAVAADEAKKVKKEEDKKEAADKATAKASGKKSKKSTKSAEESKTEEKVDAFNLDKVPAADAEAKPSDVEAEVEGEEEAKTEEEIQEERFYVVPLAKGYMKGPSWCRTDKAIRVLKAFVGRHMKPEGDVFVSQELNERLWENGIKNPPRKLRIRVTKSVDGIVRAYLA